MGSASPRYVKVSSARRFLMMKVMEAHYGELEDLLEHYLNTELDTPYVVSDDDENGEDL